MSGTALGIDIGGSGIKGAPVDLVSGELAGDWIVIPTPSPATPAAVADVIAQIIEQSGTTGPFGCTFPGIVRHGVLFSAANLGDHWVGQPFADLLTTATGRRAVVLNDADAAGVAEMRFGAGRGRDGVVLVTTLGTGIGSALFLNGELLPNTELGHLVLHGDSAEKYAAASIKTKENLSYEAWAARLQEYYSHVDFLLSPDLHIIGGGVSKDADKFLHLLELRGEVTPAQRLNEAGVVGAAMAAVEADQRN
jgi:polyphosphate glucokinase